MVFTSSRLGGRRTLALLGVTGAMMFTPGGGSAPGLEASFGSAAYAASSKPAPNKKKAPPPAKPAPVKPAPAQPSDGPSEAARRELSRLVSEINQKIAVAPNKEKAEKEAVATLQKYAQDHAREPISDAAKLMAAQLQLSHGQLEEALAVFRQVAANPLDKLAGRHATMLLADTLALNKRYDEAEKVLRDVIAKNEDADFTAAARGFLGALTSRTGQKLATFTAKDTAGHPQALSNYEGKVLLLDFWATHCPPCLQQMPDLQKLYEKYKDQGFAILGINLDNHQAKMDAYVEQQKIAWPQIYEGSEALAVAYGAMLIPHVILVDRQGVIRAVKPQPEDLEKLIAELIGEKKEG